MSATRDKLDRWAGNFRRALGLARRDTETAPTPAQKEAGNYAKGVVRLHGLKIALENPKGSKRSGVAANGTRWESTLAHDYGYIKRTEGADGDAVDVFIGPDHASEIVFVVDQCKADGRFDEHKVLLGFTSEEAARVGYLANFTDGWKCGPITTLTVDQFKQWLADGNTQKPMQPRMRVMFAKSHVQAPGSRGGHYYLTDSGAIRYGDKPAATGRAHYREMSHSIVDMRLKVLPLMRELADVGDDTQRAYAGGWLEADAEFQHKVETLRGVLEAEGAPGPQFWAALREQLAKAAGDIKHGGRAYLGVDKRGRVHWRVRGESSAPEQGNLFTPRQVADQFHQRLKHDLGQEPCSPDGCPQQEQLPTSATPEGGWISDFFKPGVEASEQAPPAEQTTPGTRVKWTTVEDWIHAYYTIVNRPISSQRHSQEDAHIAALDRETIDREADAEALDAALELLKKFQAPRGRRADEPSTQVKQWLNNRLYELRKPRRLTLEDPVWQMSPRVYQSLHGVHQPWMGEISQVQINRFSDRGLQRYQQQRHAEWDASARIKDEWRQKVIDAYRRGEINRDTPGLSEDARSAMIHADIDAKKADREARLQAARERNRIQSTGELAPGDRVYSVMLSRYLVFEKAFKTSVRVRDPQAAEYQAASTENAKRLGLDPARYARAQETFTVPVRSLDWLSYNDLVAAVDAGGPTRPERTMSKARLFFRRLFGKSQLGLFGSPAPSAAPANRPIAIRIGNKTQDPIAPGSRGGRYYVTDSGHVRYGKRPDPQPLPLFSLPKREPAPTPPPPAPAIAAAVKAGPLPNLKMAEKLRKVADNMGETIAYYQDPGISHQNVTARRSRIAAGMYEQGEHLERVQSVMNALAQMHEDGTIPEHLRTVTSRQMVDDLLRRQRRPMKDWRGNVTGTYSLCPHPILDRSQLNELRETLKNTRLPAGVRDTLARIQARGVEPDRDYHRLRALDEVDAVETATRIGMQGRSHLKWILERLKDGKRALKHGFDTDEKWDAAAADIGAMVAVAGRRVNRELVDKERALIGQKIPGYFPTPKVTVEHLLELADIQPGMSVLEPSAGKGNIADLIRERHPESSLEVIEYASNLRDILGIKNHNLIGSDFLELKPRGYTYGDLFEAPDGTRGIMRGQGGMGSNRVRLVHEHPDGERMAGYYDRDELTGLELRGSGSGYDRIVMNPPFEHGQDIDHVRHAYDLLKPGGRVVAIMCEGPFFRSDRKSSDFRAWLEQQGGISEKLPDKSFMSSERPTGVSTRVVVLDKSATAAAAPAPKPTREEIEAVGGGKALLALIDEGLDERHPGYRDEIRERMAPDVAQLKRSVLEYEEKLPEADFTKTLRRRLDVTERAMAKARLAKDLFHLVEDDLPVAGALLRPVLLFKKARYERELRALDASELREAS